MTVMLGMIEGGRRRGQQRVRCLSGITESMDMSLSKFQEMVKDREAWHAIVHGMKEESGKVVLKLSIQRTKIMASGPITSWQIEGETVEAVTDFIFLGSKFTADGDWSHEFKRCLLLGRKAMTNLDSTLKSRDIIFSQLTNIFFWNVSSIAMVIWYVFNSVIVIFISRSLIWVFYVST